MQNATASEIMMPDPIVLQPILLRPDTAPNVQVVKPYTAAPRKALLRTLLQKWDMIAVVMLLLACAVYGVYAVCFLTGF